MINIQGPAILDLNTQRDLFAPEGVMPVYQLGKFAETLRKLFVAANRLHTPVVSTRLYNQMVMQPRGGGFEVGLQRGHAGVPEVALHVVAAAHGDALGLRDEFAGGRVPSVAPVRI